LIGGGFLIGGIVEMVTLEVLGFGSFLGLICILFLYILVAELVLELVGLLVFELAFEGAFEVTLELEGFIDFTVFELDLLAGKATLFGILTEEEITLVFTDFEAVFDTFFKVFIFGTALHFSLNTLSGIVARVGVLLISLIKLKLSAQEVSKALSVGPQLVKPPLVGLKLEGKAKLSLEVNTLGGIFVSDDTVGNIDFTVFELDLLAGNATLFGVLTAVCGRFKTGFVETTLIGGAVFEGEDETSDLGVVSEAFEFVNEVFEAEVENLSAISSVFSIFLPKNPIFGLSFLTFACLVYCHLVCELVLITHI
jgi:hypothetical protein